MIGFDEVKTGYMRNKRCGNNQVVEPTIESFLMNAGQAWVGMFAGYGILVIGNDIMKIPLGNKTNGQAHQQYVG